MLKNLSKRSIGYSRSRCARTSLGGMISCPWPSGAAGRSSAPESGRSICETETVTSAGGHAVAADVEDVEGVMPVVEPHHVEDVAADQLARLELPRHAERARVEPVPRQQAALNARGGFQVAVEVALFFLQRLVGLAQAFLHPDQRQVRARQFQVLLERVVVGREEQMGDLPRVGLEQELLRAEGDLDLPVGAVFARMFGARDQALNAGGEEVLVVRLRDEPVGAALERADHVAGIGEGRQQDHRRVGAVRRPP